MSFSRPRADGQESLFCERVGFAEATLFWLDASIRHVGATATQHMLAHVPMQKQVERGDYEQLLAE